MGFAVDPISTPWLIMAGYWLFTAFRVRPTERAEPAASRLALLAAVVVGTVILSGHWLTFTWMRERFVPDVTAIKDAGIALLWIGIAFAIWARYHLGEYWSGRVTIKVGHKLIDKGPYSYIRHPIYSGILLALIGTALAVGKWRGIATFLMILIVLVLKARREENMLIGQLGETYQEYKGRTGMLLPRIG